MVNGITTDNISSAPYISEFIGNTVEDGTKKTRAVAIGSVSDQLLAAGPLSLAIENVRQLAQAGVRWVLPVALASTGNMALAGEQVMDGVLTAGSWVLLKNQTNPAENGVWVTTSGTWLRRVDADTGAELLGLAVFVSGGATNGGKQYICTTRGAITVGTTAITFQVISDQSALNATLAGKAGKETVGKAQNLIANGNLRRNGYGVLRYSPTYVAGDTAAAGRYGGVIVARTNAYLNARGCDYALEIPPVGWGNLITQEVRLVGGNLVVAFEVESSTGDWGFGAAADLSVITRHSDGTSTTYSAGEGVYAPLWSFTAVATNVRRYVFKGAISAGKTVVRLDIGLNDTSAPERTATFYLTGFWASWSDSTIDLSGTAYPNWDSAAAAPNLTTKLSDTDTAIAALQAGASATTTTLNRIINGISDLVDALFDDTRSIDLVAIGDSNTWGYGATGSTTQDPRSHALSDVRNSMDAASWLNLLHKHLGAIVCSSKNYSSPAAGVAAYYSDVMVDPIRHPAFGVYTTATGAKVANPTKSDPRAISGSNPKLQKTIDIAVGQEMRFTFTGDHFRLWFTLLNTAAGSTFDIYIDGAITNADVVSYAAASAFNAYVDVDAAAFGPHVVRLVPKVAALRVEAVEHRRRLIVRNQGLIGTTSDEWLPTGPIGLLTAVPATATTVVIMLGTNDRADASKPPYPTRTADNIEAIIAALTTSRPNAKVILKTVLKALGDKEQSGGGATFNFTSAEASKKIGNLAVRLGLGLLDVYAMTDQLNRKGVAYVGADNLHFNDGGHSALFDLWCDKLRR